MNAETIQLALEETIGRIKRNNLAGALDTRIYLNFNQLQPSKDQRTLQMKDSGRPLGSERVSETAEQLRLCEMALRDTGAVSALKTAEAALVRWKQE